MKGTGHPRAADAAPPVPEASEEDTAPLSQERGRQHRTQRLHHKQRTTRTMRRSRTCPTPSPTTRSTRRRPRSPAWQRTRTTQRVPNSMPYYQNDEQETEEPDWGRDSENEGSAHQQESLDAKPGAEDNNRATAAANRGDRRDRERGPAVPLGQQRPAEPEGPPPSRRRGRSETGAGDATTATRRPPQALQQQRNQRDRAKWRAKRAEKRRRGLVPGYFRDSGYRG